MSRLASVGFCALLGAGVAAGCGSDDEGGSGGGPGPDAGTGGGSAAGGAAAGGAVGSGGATGSGGAGTGAGGRPEQTGQSCQTPSDCYPNLDAGALSGEVECILRVEEGYCTHRCETDADCCAVPGECRTDLKQVCAPFESLGYNVCFLSCEEEDLRPAADAGTLPDGAPVAVDATEFCAREAASDFICRSSGGGSENRKICVPGGVPGDGGPPDGGPAGDAAPGAGGRSGAGGRPGAGGRAGTGGATADAAADATSDAAADATSDATADATADGSVVEAGTDSGSPLDASPD